ncbi:MAG: carbohydrate-binding module family 20 domain-containing protein [Bacteroidota bacterium]
MLKFLRLLRLLSFISLSAFIFVWRAGAQHDVMMQGFYWDVPVDTADNNGSWWDTLRIHAPELSRSGFTAIWVPPASKGAAGIWDMGYGLFDHYDLGEYSQKGTVETRFGSRAELDAMIRAFHMNGMEVYADVVMNQMMGGAYEDNPVVQGYVNNQRSPTYPTSEVQWVLADASPGDYYLQIGGYNLDWNNFSARAYELHVWWKPTPDQCPSQTVWESEPNNGNGQNNPIPGSGCPIAAHIDYQGDVDEFRFHLDVAGTVTVKIYPRYDNQGVLYPASDANGYRVLHLWGPGGDEPIKLQTPTYFSYVQHAHGDPNWTWNYTKFHPVDANDFLQDQGFEDPVVPNWKMMGEDLNTFDPEVQQRLIQWGQWLTNTIGFDGYRLDFVRGIQPEFIAQWLNAMPLKAGQKRFAVGEYWTTYKYRLHDWVNAVTGEGARVAVFDFPLRDGLRRMCNGEPGFQMWWLNHYGLAEDSPSPMPPENVVTFVENHDTGKDPAQWIYQDLDMAYAYILFAPGRPTIFYPHYFGIPLVNPANPNQRVDPEPRLRERIDQLIQIREQYLAGGMVSLTEVGNPWPSDAPNTIFVARRQGDGTHPGGILVLNQSFTDTVGVWVTVNVSGWPDMSNTMLVNITSAMRERTRVYADGRAFLSAPPRGYAIYVVDQSIVPVTFTVQHAYTYWGQNVYVVGSVPELGNWDPDHAVGPFYTDGSLYPTWKYENLMLPAATTFQYKYIVKNSDGSLAWWEPGGNHIYTTPAFGPGSVTDEWGQGPVFIGTLAISTDRPTYRPGRNVVATVIATSVLPYYDAILEVSLVDPYGNALATVSRQVGLTWDTLTYSPALTLPLSARAGGYTARVIARKLDGTSIGSATAPFEVEPVYIVWPGDANDDGVVDRRDFYVVYRFLRMRTYGPPRENATTNWLGQVATPWQNSAATFADCNGDGVVDIRDMYVVRLNFGKRHALEMSMSRFTRTDEAEIPMDIPSEYALDGNYPNPFNPATTISYALPEPCHVTIQVFDVLGRIVATLVNEEKQAGRYSVLWDARDKPSGIYFVRMVSYPLADGKPFIANRKMVLQK